MLESADAEDRERVDEGNKSDTTEYCSMDTAEDEV